jgi:medium-chain acyl-[acyl-carrier-protein] hydrolase
LAGCEKIDIIPYSNTMDKAKSEKLKSVSEYRVTSADTDMYRCIRPGAYSNILIQAAIDSADILGFGFGGLENQNLFWVLSRLTVDIKRPLNWYETVKTETWPKDIDRLLYIRDFIVTDSDNNTAARATSGWLAVDLETRRPRKVEGAAADYFVHLKDTHALKEPPERLPRVDDGEVTEIKTSYYDIDLNRHVTATRYIDWMLDTFSPDFHEKNYPSRLSINYLRETLPGEKIRLFRKKTSEGSFLFQGNNVNTDTASFRGRIDFGFSSNTDEKGGE